MKASWLILLTACAERAPCDLSAPLQCDEIRELRLPKALAPARGNRFGDDPGAAALGFTLFFDTRLGSGVSCASCHAPENAFADTDAVSVGKKKGVRNTPTVWNAARLSVLMWDGRADSLWSQPVLAIENPNEIASTRAELHALITNDTALRDAYEGVFGPLSDDVDLSTANVGKAFEAYMRKNTSGDSVFDKALDGDRQAWNAPTERGLAAFFKMGCQACHSGPMLSDEAFHVVDFPSLPGATDDLGAPVGAAILAESAFRLDGVYADDPRPKSAAPSSQAHAFRTPSLRNVARTAPYGHDGAVATLDEVLRIHAPVVDDTTRTELVLFLRALDGEIPARPWSTWPAPQ